MIHLHIFPGGGGGRGARFCRYRKVSYVISKMTGWLCKSYFHHQKGINKSFSFGCIFLTFFLFDFKRIFTSGILFGSVLD